jgi:protein TilB
MPRISLDLIKKKTEHHDGLLEDLEEITLHQLNIEKIEVIHNICKRLKQLLLQNNLISKIENVNKLKSLEYLNLALNNITKIEGLQGCEKLNKLDFTVNFIDIDSLQESIEHLKGNIFLRDLYLTGNPCTDFEGYRMFVIHTLPQLNKLDGNVIKQSERLQARQEYPSIVEKMKVLAAECAAGKIKARQEQELEDKIEAERKICEDREIEMLYEEDEDDELRERRKQIREQERWARKEQNSKYTPESRLQMYREQQAKENAQEDARLGKKESKFAPAPDLVKQAYEKMNLKVTDIQDGKRPAQRNPGRFDFSISEDNDNGTLVINIAAPRFLDTSDIDVDIHPTWLQVLIKGKNLLLHLDEEVLPDKARVQRIVSNGNLVLHLPVLEEFLMKRPKYAAKFMRQNADGIDVGTAATSSAGGSKLDWKDDRFGSNLLVKTKVVQESKESLSNTSMRRASESSIKSTSDTESRNLTKENDDVNNLANATWDTSKQKPTTSSTSSDRSGLVEVKVKLSKKLERERAAKEQQEQEERYRRIELEEQKLADEKKRKMQEKAKQEKNLAHLVDQLGIDINDVPPLM